MLHRGNLTPRSHLDALHVTAPTPRMPHRVLGLRIPGVGRLLWTRDQGQATLLGDSVMLSSLSAIHRGPDGRIKEIRDLGSGLVTNAGVNLMSWDFTWAGGSTLKQANFHAIGTGTTAAASSDVFLQTAQGATNLSGTTNGYMTGTQSIIANATGSPFSPVYQTVATFTFTGAVAVTEWILTTGNGAIVSNSSTAGVTIATSSLTDTGAAFATAGNGIQTWTLEGGFAAQQTAPINTSPTTTPMFQIASNTATVATALSNSWVSGTKTWLSLTNQAVANPTNKFYVVFPTAWDHKVFSVLNAASGDTIQFTYQLSINSGG